MQKHHSRFTPFQCLVFRAVLDIPFGETRTYAWVAEKIGKPRAVRAVGQALRRNPYPLLIPCHRVVHANGPVGAYLGRQDGTKEELIRLERELQEGFVRIFLGQNAPRKVR